MADDVLSRALLETERALDSSITRALAEGGRDSSAVAGCASSDDDSDVEAARGATSALASMQEELYRANETALEKLAASRRAAADRRDAALAKVTAYRAGRELEGRRVLEQVNSPPRPAAPRAQHETDLLSSVAARHRATAAKRDAALDKVLALSSTRRGEPAGDDGRAAAAAAAASRRAEILEEEAPPPAEAPEAAVARRRRAHARAAAEDAARLQRRAEAARAAAPERPERRRTLAELAAWQPPPRPSEAEAAAAPEDGAPPAEARDVDADDARFAAQAERVQRRIEHLRQSRTDAPRPPTEEMIPAEEPAPELSAEEPALSAEEPAPLEPALPSEPVLSPEPSPEPVPPEPSPEPVPPEPAASPAVLSLEPSPAASPAVLSPEPSPAASPAASPEPAPRSLEPEFSAMGSSEPAASPEPPPAPAPVPDEAAAAVARRRLEHGRAAAADAERLQRRVEAMRASSPARPADRRRALAELAAWQPPGRSPLPAEDPREAPVDADEFAARAERLQRRVASPREEPAAARPELPMLPSLDDDEDVSTMATRLERELLCGIQPLVWVVLTKLENSLARSNRSRFG